MIERHRPIPDSVLRFLEEITKDECVDALILFGSRAFGDHDDRSDVDVAVCGSSISRLQWARMRDAAYVARSLFWISLVHFDSNPQALKDRIIATGIPIYVRSKAYRQSEQSSECAC